MLKVDDVSAAAAHAQQLGATLDAPVHDWEYGERQATLTDPFGHQWTLTQTLADTAPESWGGETVTPR